jgi:hypothetical protein
MKSNLEKMDYKFVLNDHLTQLSRESFELLHRSSGGYYKNIGRVRGGLDMLDALLKPYHDDVYNKNMEVLRADFETYKQKEIEKLEKSGKKQQVHGGDKEFRKNLSRKEYTFLIKYTGELTSLMARKNLLLKERIAFSIDD